MQSTATIAQLRHWRISSEPLTPAWKQFRPHSTQSALYRCRARFVAVCAGRGSGKTALAQRKIIRYLPVLKEWQDPRYFYGAPTYGQVKRIAWDNLKALTPPEWIKPNGISESELTIETIFGSTLHCVSLDKPQRIEGTQWDGGILDESSDGKPGIFARTVVPALTHRDGWCWRIGVPKRHGIGAKEFREFYEKGLLPNATNASFSWPSWDILTPEQIEEAREELATKDFDEQFGGGWQSPEGQIYYGFERARNVSSEAVYNPNERIYVGSDFNVNPMSWILSHKINGKALVFDEIYLKNTNTPKTLDYLFVRYGTHENGWRFIGDATGKARKTAAVASDYILIRNDKRFIDKEVKYPDSNPAVSDRFATVNAACSNVRVLINPKCRYLIDDLESCAYKEGSREQDKSDKMSGHITDALGYFLCKEFPLRLNVGDGTRTISVVMQG